MDSLDNAEGTRPSSRPPRNRHVLLFIILDAARESLWAFARWLYNSICNAVAVILIGIVHVTPLYILRLLYHLHLQHIMGKFDWTVMAIPAFLATFISRCLFTLMVESLNSVAERLWGRAYVRRIPKWMVSKRLNEVVCNLQSSFLSIVILFQGIGWLLRQLRLWLASRHQTSKPSCQVCNDLTRDYWDGLLRHPEIRYSDLPSSQRSCSICAILLAAVHRFCSPTDSLSSRFVHLKRLSPGDETVLYWDRSKKTIHVELKGPKPARLRLAFYCLNKGPDIPLISSPKAIANDTRSEAAMHRVFSWIKACTTEHEHCSRNEPKPLPDRVLDLGESQDSPIRLTKTNNELGYYACLSHHWGKPQPLRTLTANKEVFMAGIPMAMLPKTFRDAVMACRRLNIRYFWIDSLCIVQDSTQEWQIQSSKMATIYENAFLTIAATHAKGQEEGLHTDQERHTHLECIPASEIGHGISEDIYVRSEHDPKGTIKHWGNSDPGQADKEWPLLTRAWVFQEQLLTPRMLHFTKNELVWECRTGVFCDCGMRSPNVESETRDLEFRRLVSSQSIMAKDVTPAQLRALWYDIVQRYSRVMGNLTKETDAFPALSGLASRISGLLGDDYVAGLWRGNIVEGLLWAYCINDERSGPYRIRDSPESWRAPSWSWASMTSAISYQHISGIGRRGELQEIYASVVEVECTSAGSHQTGSISSAALTLRGWVTYTIIRIKPRPWGMGWNIAETEFGPHCTLEKDDESALSLFLDHPEEVANGEKAICLRLAKIGNEEWYLVLVRESPTSESFKRIGLYRGDFTRWQWTSPSSWRRRAEQRQDEEKRVLRIL
ncbi:heterokaryon incompatibility protein-domain-containing protein [Ilyonectria destructans]|nr:heterokaryon incompatibility protein-domain-containing protein [Ilyonectria destructans]